jgi:hypothetical protein
VFAGVLPDVDAVTYLFGDVAYTNYHHTFGHNVFLGALVTSVAAWHLRSWRAAVVGLSFFAHLATDMKLSAYPVHAFWPASYRGYELTPNLGLAAPINTWLVYGSVVLAIVLAFARGVTPLDVISSRLDLRFTNAFRKKPLTCAECPRACNEVCVDCRKPVCSRHGRIDLGFRIRCSECPRSEESPP